MATPEKPDHHFVVVAWYDWQTGVYKMTVDDDVMTARFPDGPIWDGQDWHSAQNPEEGTRDWELGESISNALDKYWNIGEGGK